MTQVERTYPDLGRHHDRPRRERRDLARDPSGNWWQAVIVCERGVLIPKLVRVKARHAKPLRGLRLVGAQLTKRKATSNA